MAEAKRRKVDPLAILIYSQSTPHPLGVKPMGNLFLADSKHVNKERRSQLGLLSTLSDELIMDIFFKINDVESLKNLAHTSRYLYAYTYDEELWKKLYVRRKDININQWEGSWRSSILHIPFDQQAKLQVTLFSDLLYRPFQVSNIDYMKMFHNLIEDEENDRINPSENRPKRITRIEESSLTSALFDDEWLNTPFIITNSDKNRWPDWDLDYLLSHYPNEIFTQESVKWPLHLFISYLKLNQDESPLYLFDCDSKAIKTLATQYLTPEVFRKDYFKYLNFQNIDCRPDHCWLIIGSKGSGSTFHKDPNSTSAWNTNIGGKKLWIMLPSHITPPGVSVDNEEKEVTSPVGIGEWILSGFYNDIIKLDEVKIAITFTGECMYVPNGWWHLVINLEDSIAITENFVPENNLYNVLNFLKNKSDQISGFKLNEILQIIHKFCQENQSNPSLIQFVKDVEKLNIDLYEDCGEIENLPKLPVFELFKELLIKNGKQDTLNTSLQQLEKLENKLQYEKSGKSKLWCDLTANSNFSFGFSFD